LRHFAKPAAGELELGPLAVAYVRRWGGCLEHPWGSTLWDTAGLPKPGNVDAWGGYTLTVDQGWWGHPAPKPTYVYVVGVPKADLPPMPVQLQRAGGRTMALSPADRERTPPAFAMWLLSIASTVRLQPAAGAVTPVDRVQLRAADTQLQRAGKRAARKRAGFKEWAVGL
jgi:hypothetical protein